VRSVNPGTFDRSVLDLNRLVLQHVQIVAIYFDRQRAFEAGQCFVYGIFGRLSIVERIIPGKVVSILLIDSMSCFFSLIWAGPALSL